MTYQRKLYEMTKTQSHIPLPFNPDDFRKEGHALVDTLSNYLENALSGKEMPVLPWNDPDQLAEYFSFDSGGGKKNRSTSFYNGSLTTQSIFIILIVSAPVTPSPSCC